MRSPRPGQTTGPAGACRDRPATFCGRVLPRFPQAGSRPAEMTPDRGGSSLAHAHFVDHFLDRRPVMPGGEHSQHDPLPHEGGFFRHGRLLSPQVTSSHCPSIAEVLQVTNARPHGSTAPAKAVLRRRFTTRFGEIRCGVPSNFKE